TLPAAQINIDEISKQFGTEIELKDIELQIEIRKPDTESLIHAERAAQHSGFSIVTVPVEFNVSYTYKDDTVYVNQFDAYVERSIVIPSDFDPNKITTGIVIEENGSVRHVPTKIVHVD